MIIVLGISEQEDFHRPEILLEKTQEIDNEARISKKAEMKRKFNINQKHITLWDAQLTCLTSLEAATGGVLWKKLENFARFTNFARTPLDDCSWLFRASFTKMGYCQQCLGNVMNIHYLETLTLEVPFRYIISFFGRINFQCMFSLVYTAYCQKQSPE